MRFVCLPHTEGCGSRHAQGDASIYERTVVGHLTHPTVEYACLLEHGCEFTHNDSVSRTLADSNISPSKFGWVSVQGDGGIQKASDKVITWFRQQQQQQARAPDSLAPVNMLGSLVVGLLSQDKLPAGVGKAFSMFMVAVVVSGGSVVVPETSSLLRDADFLDGLMEGQTASPTLAFSQKISQPGVHVMACPTNHWVESAVGLVGSGATALVGFASTPRQGHPMSPQLIVNTADKTFADTDVCLQPGHSHRWHTDIIDALAAVMGGWRSCESPPASWKIPKIFLEKVTSNVSFQITRGLTGVSV